MLTGYLSDAYTSSLLEFGHRAYLQRLNLALMKRKIDERGISDYTNFYPMAFVKESNHDWWGLELETAHKILTGISLTLITDPLIKIDEFIISQFDYAKKYKTHYLVNLKKELQFEDEVLNKVNEFNSTGYEVKIKISTESIAQQFWKLYQNLIKKHNITGIAAFSEQSIIKQFQVPGIVVFEASKDKGPVCIRTFYIQGDNVYYHLGASNHKGYGIQASYAIHYEAIRFFKQLGLNYLVLGGTTDGANAAGLERFKKLWANETRTNYILGKILNKEIYDILSKDKTGDYFPLYRSES